MDKIEQINILKEGIKKYVPVVAEFFDQEETIIDFSKKIFDYSTDKTYENRQNDLCLETQRYVERLFGVKINITPPLIINIVDHHAILNHPILLATNIIANAYRLFQNGVKQPIIVFTSSIVPVNNFFNKKGFELHRKRVPLFSNKEMHQANCFLEKQDFDFIKRLKDIDNWGMFGDGEKQFLLSIEKEILALDFSRAQSYNDQISIINNFLWKKIFHEDVRGNIPELYYLTQEDIARDLASHILCGDNIVSKAIFDADFRQIVLNNFRGVTVCWDEEKNKGTHFFWYKDENNESKRLFLKDQFLVSENGLKKIKLIKEEIISLIEKNEIVPSLFVVFSYMTFWCGLKPLVGYGSCNYLTKMKETWLKTLKDNDTVEYERMLTLDTKSLIGGEIATYGRNEKHELIDLYAFDIIEKGGLTKQYLEKLFSMRFRDLLMPALPEIYKSYVPTEERQELDLKSEDLVGNLFDWIK